MESRLLETIGRQTGKGGGIKMDVISAASASSKPKQRL